MPAFYPRSMPRDLPLTPPEFIPSYNNGGCGGMQYQQAPYSAHPGVTQEAGYSYAERYGQTQPLTAQSSIVYQQSSAFASHAPTLPPTNSFFEPAVPLLPPMRVNEYAALPDAGYQQHRRQEQVRVEPPKEEKAATGGVSAKLDYEMETMTEFVADMACGIVLPRQPMEASFKKWVAQVLVATRLPSATILLSLHYLSIRMTMLQHRRNSEPYDNVKRMLTIALVLGSKFLDDNTFINRSWGEVSGIPVPDLNRLEAEWLVAIDYNLHRDPEEAHGFSTWHAHWKNFEAEVKNRAMRVIKLSPIDTTVQRQRSVRKAYSPPSYQQPFTNSTPEYSAKPTPPAYTPAYTPYDPWMSSRSASSSSPSSAPHTGPATPEYYGGAGVWAPLDGSRRTLFGFHTLAPPQPQPQVQSQTQPPPASYASGFASAYNNHSYWNQHAFGCQCYYCGQQNPSYIASSRYGTMAVAA